MSANSSPKNPTNYLIIGNAGVGKTTVIGRLQELGYNAHDLDEVPGACGWLNDDTGEQKYDLTPEEKPLEHIEWHWSWVRTVIEKALVEAPADVNFWAGSAHNQADFYDDFDGVFALFCSIHTLAQRLNTRTTNNYGKELKDYVAILERHGRLQDEFMNYGAVMIDASRTVTATTQDIIDFLPPDVGFLDDEL